MKMSYDSPFGFEASYEMYGVEYWSEERIQLDQIHEYEFRS